MGKMKEFLFRTGFNYDTDQASQESGLSCPLEESVTQEQFKEECDINTIVKRFGLTGEMPQNLRLPVSGDFTGITDFHSAMNLVVEAQEGFMSLPAEMRQRFNHDPGQLLAFLADEGNRDEAIKLGLVAKPPEVTRDVVQAVDELAAKMTINKP